MGANTEDAVSGQVNVIAITAMMDDELVTVCLYIKQKVKISIVCLVNCSLLWTTLLCHNLYFALKIKSPNYQNKNMTIFTIL